MLDVLARMKDRLFPPPFPGDPVIEVLAERADVLLTAAGFVRQEGGTDPTGDSRSYRPEIVQAGNVRALAFHVASDAVLEEVLVVLNTAGFNAGGIYVRNGFGHPWGLLFRRRGDAEFREYMEPLYPGFYK